MISGYDYDYDYIYIYIYIYILTKLFLDQFVCSNKCF